MWWVIQDNIYSEENFENLLATLDQLSLPYSLHRCVPFVGTLEPEPAPPDDNVIVMGSYTLARYGAQRGWEPGAFLDNLDFEIQREHWGDRMLNVDALVTRFGDVPPQPLPFFMRPVADTKAFTGEVTDWPSFVEWRERIAALRITDAPTVTLDTQIMICRKKAIYSETRTWVIDQRVVTASGYKVGTLKRYTSPEQVDQRITDFAAECAAIWSPNRAYVLDVADTADGLKIVEINNLNSAGWYRCDMQKLVMALEEMQ